MHRASRDEPQYGIKSDKTDHIAMHKGRVLNKTTIERVVAESSFRLLTSVRIKAANIKTAIIGFFANGDALE
jgi:hypothetical protein